MTGRKRMSAVLAAAALGLSAGVACAQGWGGGGWRAGGWNGGDRAHAVAFKREDGGRGRGGWRGGGYGNGRGYGEERGYGVPAPRGGYGGERGYGGAPEPFARGPAGGYGARAWRRGQVLPEGYRGATVADPGRYHLRRAPNGYDWVGDARNAYLMQRSTGMVLDSVPGAYDPPPPYRPRGGRGRRW